ncbi:MAG TPA: cytochrome ubiquinol oxidase subunit I [Stellaceae bacterium]|nr:cytochrome ubiquinol oxidase subunit I [Stellaceae bacterium]
MNPETVLVSRIQFALTIGYHILWPAYSIGVSGYIVLLNGLWLATGRAVYRDLLRFWIHLFALGFAMGVVTGVVISYEIGTNWGGYADKVSNVIGPFFTYEVMTAFFLEAGFIGIMLFGMDRVGKGLHFVACLFVALGALVSAFWILAANSWMQTPAGFTLAGGKFQIADWGNAIFNPSFPYRFAHMVTAAYIAGAFVVIGVTGFYLWRRRHREFARAGFSLAMWIALVLTPLQLYLGDLHGRNTLQYQPIKVAAMEGDWDTRRGQPLVIFAWPDQSAQKNLYELAIPNAGSLILTHSWNGLVKGLKAVPRDEQPPVPYVFYAFRVMVGIGALMVLIALAGLALRLFGRLYDTRWFAALCAFSSPLPFFAILAGWTVTEVGRQPYIVYGYLRTADAVSPVAPRAVETSLALFFIVYAVLLLAFFWYAAHIVFRGPTVHEPAERPHAVRPGKDAAPAGRAVLGSPGDMSPGAGG